MKLSFTYSGSFYEYDGPLPDIYLDTRCYDVAIFIFDKLGLLLVGDAPVLYRYDSSNVRWAVCDPFPHYYRRAENGSLIEACGGLSFND